MYRLYVDEVGTDDMGSFDSDNERFLSLTGVVMLRNIARDMLEPRLNALKAEIFNQDPDDPVILHRRKIMGQNGPFGALRNKENRERFDLLMMRIKRELPYRVITVLIDKKAMLKREHWRNHHPYHFLMEVLIEKYVQFLEREQSTGDIMPEGRKGLKDHRLQQAFSDVKAKGTYFIPPDRLARRIPASHLKFRYKRDNVAGLQLADLLAHPSHMIIRQRMGHSVMLGSYCQRIKQLLEDEKYDRSGSGNIVGYGVKWLP